MAQGDLPDWLDVPASEVLGEGSEGLCFFFLMQNEKKVPSKKLIPALFTFLFISFPH